MDYVNMSIGSVLKDRRISLSIKQEHIAEQMGVTVQTVSKWERGITEPKASQVSQLSKILKITEKEICRGEIVSKKSDPFEFVRRVSILMSEIPHTELLVGMHEFIDDEEGFIKMLSKVSAYPYELFEEEEKQHAKWMLNLIENGSMKFDNEEEEKRTREAIEKTLRGNK